MEGEKEKIKRLHKALQFLLTAILIFFALSIINLEIKPVLATNNSNFTITCSMSGEYRREDTVYLWARNNASANKVPCINGTNQYSKQMNISYQDVYSVYRATLFFATANTHDFGNVTLNVNLINLSYSDFNFPQNITVWVDSNGVYPRYPLSSDYVSDYDFTLYDLMVGNATATSLGWFSIPLNPVAVNKTGLTRLVLRTSDDVKAIAPVNLTEGIEFSGKNRPLSEHPNLTFSYAYTLNGIFDESTGLLKPESERGVSVTAYFSSGKTSETFTVNGTYTFWTPAIPVYFDFDLGDKNRQYWIAPNEYGMPIYIFNETLTTYTVSFLDLTGVLKTHPFIEAKRYINGSLLTVEKRKADIEAKVVFNLKMNTRYTLTIGDGEVYTFGDLTFTSLTTIALTLKGIEFPKEVLATYKYVRIFGVRIFATPNGSIIITYEDLLDMTISVTIYINYKNGSSATTPKTYYTSKFVYAWGSAMNDTDYRVVCHINHAKYGEYDWKQYFPRGFSTAPWGLEWFGKFPFESAYLFPAILILFFGAAFSVLNVYVGAFAMSAIATVFSYSGWCPIPAPYLVAAWTFTIFAGIIYAKKRVQT